MVSRAAVPHKDNVHPPDLEQPSADLRWLPGSAPLPPPAYRTAPIPKSPKPLPPPQAAVSSRLLSGLITHSGAAPRWREAAWGWRGGGAAWQREETQARPARDDRCCGRTTTTGDNASEADVCVDDANVVLGMTVGSGPHPSPPHRSAR
jgi:hypothetical protein